MGKPIDRNLPASYVKSLLAYDPVKGTLRWKVNRRPRGKKGQRAGCKNDNGYWVIGIDGSMYLGHRLVWLIMTGKFPSEQVDHKNGQPSDLRWKILRAATHSENKQNQGANKNNKAGQKGVHKRKDCNRWTAFIQRDNKTFYLGLFKTKKEAAAAYKEAALKLHKKFARF